MSKLAEVNTPEVRVALFAEELKAILNDGNKLTKDIVDYVGSTYESMITIPIGSFEVTLFYRDYDNANDNILIFDDPDEDKITKALNDAGIDYILEPKSSQEKHSV